MKLSIIIPVYNGANFVEKCLDSVIEQLTADMEVVLINDGSKDNTQAIIEQYMNLHSDKNIRLINKENAGLPQARKTGVEQARGEYIGFLDVDDWVDENYYTKMLEAVVSKKADVVCSAYKMEYSDRTKEVKQSLTSGDMMTGKQALKCMHDKTAVFPYAWNKLYKKALLEVVEYPCGNFVGEDYTITTQVFEQAEIVYITNEVYCHYVQVENSMCRGGYNESYVYAFKNYKEIGNKLISKYPDYRSSIMNYGIIEYMAMIVAMGKNKKYNEEMIKEIVGIVRKGLMQFLSSKNVSVVMKGSAVAVTINYRLLIIVYRIMAKMTGVYVKEK